MDKTHKHQLFINMSNSTTVSFNIFSICSPFLTYVHRWYTFTVNSSHSSKDCLFVAWTSSKVLFSSITQNAAFKAILDLYTLATRFQITAYINTNGQHGHSIVLNWENFSFSCLEQNLRSCPNFDYFANFKTKYN